MTFDSLAQAPCAYKIEYDFVHMGELEADFLAKQMHKKGNVLEVRGIPGTSVDKQIHEGVVKKRPRRAASRRRCMADPGP